MSTAEGFVAPEMIVEGKAIALAVMSLPMPDIRTMPRAEREMHAWTEYRRQLGALHIANRMRWNIDKPETIKSKANNRSRP
jgi:hypothetical protein